MDHEDMIAAIVKQYKKEEEDEMIDITSSAEVNTWQDEVPGITVTMPIEQYRREQALMRKLCADGDKLMMEVVELKCKIARLENDICELQETLDE